jgi:hypothetical protein
MTVASPEVAASQEMTAANQEMKAAGQEGGEAP